MSSEETLLIRSVHLRFLQQFTLQWQRCPDGDWGTSTAFNGGHADESSNILIQDSNLPVLTVPFI